MAGERAPRRLSCRRSRRAAWARNEYYKSDEEYFEAVADAMREEYQAIVDAGLRRCRSTTRSCPTSSSTRT